MNNIKNKPILLFLVTMAVLIALVVTSTVSWFVMNHEVSVTAASDKNLAVQINTGDLEIAVSYQIATVGDEHYTEFSEYSEYGDKFDLSIPTPQFMDVTGNGQYLWYPSYLDDFDRPNYTDPNVWSEVGHANNMNYCMTLHLKFRTTQKMDVYLDSRSFITGVEELTGADITRSNAISNKAFSADAICGCVRAAFLEGHDLDGEDPYEELKLVWIPNDDIRVSYENSTAILTTGVDSHATNIYYHKVGPTMQRYEYGALTPPRDWDDSSYGNGKVLVGQGSLATPSQVNSSAMANAGAPLLSFEKEGVVQEKELVVRIWFEGTDNEADKACDGGKVKYQFGFTGINKEPATEIARSAVASIRYYGSELHWGDDYGKAVCSSPYEYKKDGKTEEVVSLLYSYDCIDWMPYGANHDEKPFDTTVARVYLRSAETASNLSSQPIALLISENPQG